MGCGSSKNAVKEIDIQEVNRNNINVASTDETQLNKSNAVMIGVKSSSAKSRDSGIQEMDYTNAIPNGIITDADSDPHHIASGDRPKTPDLDLRGKKYHNSPQERMESKQILEELESQGFIQGTRINNGGTAFAISMQPNKTLTPLTPIVKKTPKRLERLNSAKKKFTKEELDQKLKEADDRRIENHRREKSRLAKQLAAHVEKAREVGGGGEGSFNEENQKHEQIMPKQQKTAEKVE